MQIKKKAMLANGMAVLTTLTFQVSVGQCADDKNVVQKAGFYHSNSSFFSRFNKPVILVKSREDKAAAEEICASLGQKLESFKVVEKSGWVRVPNNWKETLENPSAKQKLKWKWLKKGLILGDVSCHLNRGCPVPSAKTKIYSKVHDNALSFVHELRAHIENDESEKQEIGSLEEIDLGDEAWAGESDEVRNVFALALVDEREHILKALYGDQHIANENRQMFCQNFKSFVKEGSFKECKVWLIRELANIDRKINLTGIFSAVQGIRKAVSKPQPAVSKQDLAEITKDITSIKEGIADGIKKMNQVQVQIDDASSGKVKNFESLEKKAHKSFTKTLKSFNHFIKRNNSTLQSLEGVLPHTHQFPFVESVESDSDPSNSVEMKPMSPPQKQESGLMAQSASKSNSGSLNAIHLNQWNSDTIDQFNQKFSKKILLIRGEMVTFDQIENGQMSFWKGSKPEGALHKIPASSLTLSDIGVTQIPGAFSLKKFLPEISQRVEPRFELSQEDQETRQAVSQMTFMLKSLKDSYDTYQNLLTSENLLESERPEIHSKMMSVRKSYNRMRRIVTEHASQLEATQRATGQKYSKWIEVPSSVSNGYAEVDYLKMIKDCAADPSVGRNSNQTRQNNDSLTLGHIMNCAKAARFYQTRESNYRALVKDVQNALSQAGSID